jgi:hypothetical protein
MAHARFWSWVVLLAWPLAGWAAEPVANRAKALSGSEVSARIDKLILDKLAESKIPASSRATDAEYLRRVYLDLAGRIPTAEEAKAFLDSNESDKRAKLVDSLLAGKDHARHLADIWQGLLLSRNSDSRRVQRQPFTDWITEQFEKNRPYNEIVRAIVTADGPQDKNPATTFWLTQVTVDRMTDTIGKVFMGSQIQCAQCHNHPFTGWKQEEYWGMAAFVMKVAARPPGNKQTESPVVKETPKVVKGRKNLPESVKFVDAKFFGGDKPKVKEAQPLRPVLADWLCATDNPYLAKATVNRLWAQMFGRGLVHPVDNINDTNPASHPELLDELTVQFQAGGFDLRAMLRSMALSETYQRSSKPVPGNEDALAESYARMPIKVLTAEQLFDSIVTVLGAPEVPAAARRRAQMNNQNPNPNGPRQQFLALFEGDPDADATEYLAGIPQVLSLMNSPRMNTPGAAVRLTQGLGNSEAIDKLYLATLSRPANAEEKERALKVVRASDKPRLALGDVLWALMNSTAFASNY